MQNIHHSKQGNWVKRSQQKRKRASQKLTRKTFIGVLQFKFLRRHNRTRLSYLNGLFFARFSKGNRSRNLSLDFRSSLKTLNTVIKENCFAVSHNIFVIQRWPNLYNNLICYSLLKGEREFKRICKGEAEESSQKLNTKHFKISKRFCSEALSLHTIYILSNIHKYYVNLNISSFSSDFFLCSRQFQLEKHFFVFFCSLFSFFFSAKNK